MGYTTVWINENTGRAVAAVRRGESRKQAALRFKIPQTHLNYLCKLLEIKSVLGRPKK